MKPGVTKKPNHVKYRKVYRQIWANGTLCLKAGPRTNTNEKEANEVLLRQIARISMKKGK